MKLVYSTSTREIVGQFEAGSTSEHVLSWSGGNPVLAPGYSFADVDSSVPIREPSKYEADGRITKIQRAPKEDRIALLEAEIAAMKVKQAATESELAAIKTKQTEQDQKLESVKP